MHVNNSDCDACSRQATSVSSANGYGNKKCFIDNHSSASPIANLIQFNLELKI
jgi:hypothetical protein